MKSEIIKFPDRDLDLLHPSNFTSEVVIPRRIGLENYMKTLINLSKLLGDEKYYFEPVGTDGNTHLYFSRMRLLEGRKNA
ncbi:hypothetical protein HY448_01775 [Candidatus Pacearchaeota archaeon]|nr:hypothetical protein [Candidatus Pacearchaeota archaeon]